MKTNAQRIAEMTQLYTEFNKKTDPYIDKLLMQEGPYQLDLQIAARACMIAGNAATVLRNAIIIMDKTRLSDGKSVEDLATEMFTISRIFDALSQTYLDNCGLSVDILKAIGTDDFKQVVDHDLQDSANMLQRYIDEFKRQHPNVNTDDPNDILYPDPKNMN